MPARKVTITLPKLTAGEVVSMEEKRRQARLDRQQAASDKAAQGMAAELARVAERDRQRQEQEDGMDFIMGRETEGAARAGAKVKELTDRAAAARQRALDAGDPLYLQPGHKRPKKAPAKPSAQPKTRRAIVSHPTVAGQVESVQVVVVSLEGTLKRAKVEKDGRLAAEKFAQAWETVYGQAGGAADFDRVRAGKGGGGLPPYMEACETLRVAKYRLDALSHTIVENIVGRTMTIENCARLIFKIDPPRRSAKDDVRHRLRDGLHELATLWFPTSRNRQISGYAAPEGHVVAEHDEMPEATAVHATRRQVFRSGA
jgi:hypothetical protein